VLAAGWRAVDFLSDLHLAEGMPATFAAWAATMRGSAADAIVLLGDLFEVWVGDDAASRPFEAQCLAVLREAVARRPVWLLHGNRDFLLGDAFFAATGVRPLADPATLHGFGTRVVVSHGDALCLADSDYQAFRAQVRGAAWQAAFLARPLAERVAEAARMRAASRARQQEPVTHADADPALTQAWLAAANAGTLVHGHTHRPSDGPFAGGVRHVLSDWDLDTPGAPRRAEVLRWTATGFARLSPAAALRAEAR